MLEPIIEKVNIYARGVEALRFRVTIRANAKLHASLQALPHQFDLGSSGANCGRERNCTTFPWQRH